MPYPIDMDRLIAGGAAARRGQDRGDRARRQRRLPQEPERARACDTRISGCALAAEAGMPDEVLNSIACHAKEGEGAPQTLETVLIHQADFATFDPLVMMVKRTLIRRHGSAEAG